MGRYLKGPFPLGSVLCTYERPLEIQYNTIQYNTTLRERRIQLTDKFANKCLGSSRFSHWFPQVNGRRSGRCHERYEEKFAKCDRLKNSLLFYMRHRLNGKQGKIYGEPYFVRHAGLLVDRMLSVRHLNFWGWKMSDTLSWRVGKCPSLCLGGLENVRHFNFEGWKMPYSLPNVSSSNVE